MDGELRVALGPGQSIDDALLNGAVLELSAEAISERIGGILSPPRVMLRLRELLSGGTRLDDLEHERAVMMLLEKNLIALQNLPQKGSEEYRVLLSYAKALFDRMDKRKASIQAELNTYDQNVGRQLGHVVDLAMGYLRGAVRDQIDGAKWDELVEEAMAMAWNEIQKQITA
ncbi:hypothetical protein MRBLMI12_000424 [Microbacterium sp. LMI12-1-1.1]|uniref:hypothetical protein n=1 Tax=Microbacterium sp. LMI12-1-1.1 TaxID=3135225 RepID=UPI003427D154